MTFEDDLPGWRALARARLGDWKAERERRIQAERERDEARSRLAEAAKEIREQGETIAELAAESRTLVRRDPAGSGESTSATPPAGRTHDTNHL